MDLASSSEFQDAIQLLERFQTKGRSLRRRVPRTGMLTALPSPATEPRRDQRAIVEPPRDQVTARPAPAARQLDPVPRSLPQDQRGQTPGYRQQESKGERIEEILEGMCLRGGFHGAVLADNAGLAIADYRCPVETEAIAACSSVLGSAMQRAGSLLEQSDANHMTMDINFVDKVVLRQFDLDGEPCHLLIICPQDVDERSELELSIERIAGMLSSRNA